MIVFCGPSSRNGQPRRLVVVKNGDGREYRDYIDANSGFQRQALLERAAAQFDLPAEELAPLTARWWPRPMTKTGGRKVPKSTPSPRRSLGCSAAPPYWLWT